MINIKELQQKFDELFADVNADDNFKVFVQNKINAESHTHGRTAEEIEALAEKIIWADNTVGTGDVKHEKKGFVKGYNQAMHEFRTQPDYIQNRQEGVTKFLTVAEMKDFEQKVTNGEWSYSFMVEHLCKMADNYRPQPQEARDEEINLLKKQLEKEEQDHYYTRCAWEQTSLQLQKLKNKDK